MTKGIGTTVNTPEFRGCYLTVFEPKLNTLNGKMQYSVTALFKKGQDLKAMQDAAQAACVQRWGSDKAKWPKNIRSPFRDQAEKEKEGELPAGHVAGAAFVTFSTNENPRSPKPAVFDQRNKRIEPADCHRVTSGFWFIANVTAGCYPSKKDEGKGISPGVKFYLNGLQLVREDEPLSGRPNVEKAFAPVEGFSEDVAAEGAGGLFNSLT